MAGALLGIPTGLVVYLFVSMLSDRISKTKTEYYLVKMFGTLHIGNWYFKPVDGIGILIHINLFLW
jgi:hypothetical protein